MNCTIFFCCFLIVQVSCLRCYDCNDNTTCTNPSIYLVPIVECKRTGTRKPVCFQFYYVKDGLTYRGCYLIDNTMKNNKLCRRFNEIFVNERGLHRLNGCYICDFDKCNTLQIQNY